MDAIRRNMQKKSRIKELGRRTIADEETKIIIEYTSGIVVEVEKD